jgi:hypothetical protein
VEEVDVRSSRPQYRTTRSTRAPGARLLPALALLVALTGCTPDGDRDDEPGAPAPTGTPGAGSGPARGGAAPDEGAEAAPEGVRPVTLAFAGDVHFEGGVADLLGERGSSVGRMAPALRSADVAVVNLETALTSRAAPAAKELEDPARRYWFRTPPAALDVLERSGVDVVSMANNHGADHGARGVRDALRAARGSEVAVVGIGADAAQAFRPHRVSVQGTDVAVLAADASRLESRDPVWDVARGDGPGIARAGARLRTAVREAARTNDVVAVYLHWGAENVSCPTDGQLRLAQQLADAGADVVVGSHAHMPQGAGMLGSTYVSYGLGNFLWYHGNQPDTGVLRLQVTAAGVVGEEWVPGEIPERGGPPRPLSGRGAERAVEDWQDLRGCTGLAPGPGALGSEGAEGGASAALPPYASSIRSLPAATRERMRGASHASDRCPVDLADLRLLELSFVGFDGRARTGQLVVHRDHARDVASVFGELYRERFPVRRMQLVDDYGGDDERSMAANNTSAYNCRTVAGSSGFSRHAYGAAVDINPVENPYVTPGDVAPDAGRRFLDVDRSGSEDLPPGVIADGDVVVRAFAEVGWSWGGTWADPDYQHFFVS